MIDPVIVMNGDLVTQVDIGRLLAHHERRGFLGTVGVRPHSLQIPYGVVQSDSDTIHEMQEKPTMQYLINAGIYVLSPELIRRVTATDEYPITALIEDALDRGDLIGSHLVSEDWIDVGHLEELRRARGETT